MKINVAKTKMAAGQPAFGYALELGSPIAAELIAGTGVDFVMVDTQHGSFGPESTTRALMAIAAAAADAVPMARVARNDYTLIGRLLDEGAVGIVVPMVNAPGEAKAAAEACRFPPRGARSWGWGRAGRYGDDYADWIDEQVFVAVQIESAEAVTNAEAILATPGVDGCWIGPSDLAVSLGLHPRDAAGADRHERAIAQVLAACRNTGKIPGYAAYTPEDALLRADQGFLFLTAGCDLEILLAGARSGVAQLFD
ncbi:MAG: HpcH/HpaI aldolase family protein [Thermomicrobiales bacterium]